MTKQFTTEQLFTIVDGRLSTKLDDVYDMLNHITGEEHLMTHHLPTAFDYVKEKNPKWMQDVKADLDEMGNRSLGISTRYKDEFEPFIELVKTNNKIWDIPQLSDEFDISDFGNYMVDNSLL